MLPKQNKKGERRRLLEYQKIFEQAEENHLGVKVEGGECYVIGENVQKGGV